MKFIVTILVASITTSCCRSSAQAAVNPPPVSANPGRPTVSTPATLTPVGYLQFENGGLYGRTSGEFATRIGANQVTKLSVLPRLEFLLLSEPMVGSTGSAHSSNRPGEVFAGAQGVIFGGIDTKPTLAVSYIRRLHQSPAPELDTGTFRQSATLLLSFDFARFHADANAIFTEQVNEPVRRAQFGQTLSISRQFGKSTVSAELWHFTQPLIQGNAVGNLWAESYALKRNLVVDCGFDHGLTSTSTQWEGFVGFTYLLPHRLWKEQRR